MRKMRSTLVVAISLALLTHPLLDAHTAYGTQLFWPLTVPPTSWATVFIIDPIFTLPLLIATVMTALRPARPWSAPCRMRSGRGCAPPTAPPDPRPSPDSAPCSRR
mgnify:CR=1 FL=1